ncbi:hypothetical protein BH10BAC1_BH10BAC1_04980 [soil metagenome]
MNFDNQLDQKIPNWVIKNLRKAETLSLLIITIALILKTIQLVDLTPLLTVTFSTLAVFYFFRAYKNFEDINKTEQFFNKALPYAWSMCVISILFIIQGWPGAQQIAPIGIIILIAISLVVVFFKQKNPNFFKTIDKELLVRNFIIATLSITLLLTPTEVLIKCHIVSKHVETNGNTNAP